MCALSLIEKEAIILENDADPQRILNILIELQFASEEGYIDQETAQLVAEHLHLTEARVYEIVSFYAILKTEPQAKYVLKICNSTPCHYTWWGDGCRSFRNYFRSARESADTRWLIYVSQYSLYRGL